MPRMACIDCGAFVAEAESWQTMLVKMVQHHLEDHHDIISGHTDRPAGAWMERFMVAYRASEDADATGP